jgi:hypothetical protein
MNKIDKHNYEAFMLDYMEGNLDVSGVKDLFAFFELYPELKPESFDDTELLSLEADTIYFENKNSLKRIDENKEALLVAYLEGDLSGDEKQAFEKELTENASLQAMLGGYKNTLLIAPNDIRYEAKINLKQTPIQEDILIAYSEGILSKEEKLKLDAQLKSDAVATHLIHLYAQTKLVADTSIVFPHKASLKRKGLVVLLNTYWKPLSMAASLLLLVGLFWLLNKSSTPVSDKNNELVQKDTSHLIQHSTKDSLMDQLKIVTPHNSSIALQNNNTGTQQTVSNHNSPQHKNVHHGMDSLNSTNQNGFIKQNQIAIQQPQKIIIDSSNKNANAIALINIHTNEYSLNYYTDETDENTTATVQQTLTTKEYLAKKVTEAAWGKTKDETVASTPSKKKVRAFDVLALIGKGLKKLGSKNSDAKKVLNEDTDESEYVVTIGGVSLKKKASN